MEININAEIKTERDGNREDYFVVFPTTGVEIWVGAVISNSYGPYSDSWGLFGRELDGFPTDEEIVEYAIDLLAESYAELAELKDKLTRRNKQIKRLRAALKK